MISAAAAALRPAGTGGITARGTLSRSLACEPHRDVCEGGRQAWQRKQAAAGPDAMTGQARADPGAARQVPAMPTAGCRAFTASAANASSSSARASPPATAGSQRPRPHRPPSVNPGNSRMTLVTCKAGCSAAVRAGPGMVSKPDRLARSPGAAVTGPLETGTGPGPEVPP